jgi:predicted amidophosphoribosyltransferase
MIGDLLKTFFSFLFPPSCILCTVQTKKTNICNECIAKLPLTREFRKPWLFSLYQYRDDLVTQSIHHIKTFPDTSFVYRLMTEHQYLLLHWTMGMLRLHNCNHIIFIPTPIHRSRFLDRGYNQTEIIAQAYQHITQQAFPSITTSIRTDILTKKYSTEKQALIMNKKERLKNVIGAFTTTGREAALPAQSLIIIIDDVTTTGGTLQEIYNQFTDRPVVAFTLAH